MEALCQKQLKKMEEEELKEAQDDYRNEMEEKKKNRQSGIGHHNPVYSNDEL